jgi:hypothetical protein
VLEFYSINMTTKIGGVEKLEIKRNRLQVSSKGPADWFTGMVR